KDHGRHHCGPVDAGHLSPAVDQSDQVAGLDVVPGIGAAVDQECLGGLPRQLLDHLTERSHHHLHNVGHRGMPTSVPSVEFPLSPAKIKKGKILWYKW